MLFNSFAFAIFLPTVYGIYWLLDQRPLKYQNFLLLAASYLFYGWWDWRFLGLILLSTVVDFAVGLQLSKTEGEQKRRSLLMLSLVANLGILGFFKYFGFFVDSFVVLLGALGYQGHVQTLRIILPVGVSFYTFQTMSYTIDVYRRHIDPARDAVAFFTYVAFFPQLVAGPIERARNLLPQFMSRRKLDGDQARDGLLLILWGLFKKVVIADNLAPLVDQIYGNHASYGAITLVLGTVYFAFQIYCDFSGYSDIAIGTARLFGFSLMRNFAFPYLSRDIGEFWRRWHISLSTWFRDYVFIPLGGSHNVSRGRHLVNILVTFTLSGLWHGASWSYVTWGFLNGIYYIPLVIMGKHKSTLGVVAEGRLLPNMREVFQIGSTFVLTLIAWVFFRSDSVTDAFGLLSRVVSGPWGPVKGTSGLPYIGAIFIMEWFRRRSEIVLRLEGAPVPIRWLFYYAVVTGLLLFGNTGNVSFIYFQF